jgi:hypothetical protein
MFKNWWKRLSVLWGYHFEDYPKLNCTIMAYTYEIMPRTLSDGDDTNRWKVFYLRITLGERALILDIPYKRLPDYVPTESMLKRRARRRQLREQRLQLRDNK